MCIQRVKTFEMQDLNLLPQIEYSLALCLIVSQVH